MSETNDGKAQENTGDSGQDNNPDPSPKDTTDYKALYEKEKGLKNNWMAKATDYEKRYNGVDPEKYKAISEEVETLRQKAAGGDPKELQEYKSGLESRLRNEIQEDLDAARNQATQAEANLKKYLAINEINKTKLLDPKALDLLGAKINDSTKVVDGNLIVVDKDGNQRYQHANPNQPFSVADLAAELAEEYPFAALSKQSHGAMDDGTRITVNGGNEFERYLKMNNTERAKHFKPDQRMKFAAMAMSRKH